MIGFLSTIDNPLLPYHFAAAKCEGVTNICFILDSKLISEKDRRIWEIRTNGAFEGPPQDSIPKLHQLGEDCPPAYFVDSHNSDSSKKLYKKLGLICLYNAGCPRKLSKEIINSIPKGVVNVHPGILPEYRGCSCVEWGIYNDDKIGNTAHFMAEEYDQGAVIKSEWYEFPSNSSYVDIRTRIYRESIVLGAKCLKLIEDGKLSPADAINQDETNAKLWYPTPPEIEDAAIRKANRGEYLYQNL